MLERRLAEVEQLLARLNTLQDPHMEFTLLPSFFFCGKMAYSMRTVDLSQQEEVLISFNQAMQGALERLIELLSARLNGHRHRFRWPRRMELRQAEQQGPATFHSLPPTVPGDLW